MNRGRLKIGAAVVLCAPFVPMLFQGEEFGASTPFLYFTDHHDPDVARTVSEGRRREFAAFGWKAEDIPDPQDRHTFLRSKLDWTEPEREPHATLLDWYRRLIALRREIPALRDGRMDEVAIRFEEGARWMTIRRGPIAVAFNLDAATQTVPLPFDGTVVMSSAAEIRRIDGAVELLPDSVAVIREEFA